jgi:hypothetical protein
MSSQALSLLLDTRRHQPDWQSLSSVHIGWQMSLTQIEPLEQESIGYATQSGTMSDASHDARISEITANRRIMARPRILEARGCGAWAVVH